MEGISTISYQGMTILVIDFSNLGKSKEGTLALIKAMGDEFAKNPLHSVLALINLTNSFFHVNTLTAFKSSREACGPYEKKVAVVGLKGLMKTGFKTVTGSDKVGTVMAFDSVQEAKEWLVS